MNSENNSHSSVTRNPKKLQWQLCKQGGSFTAQWQGIASCCAMLVMVHQEIKTINNQPVETMLASKVTWQHHIWLWWPCSNSCCTAALRKLYWQQSTSGNSASKQWQQQSHGTVMVALWLILRPSSEMVPFWTLKKQASNNQPAQTASKTSHISGKWCSWLQTVLPHFYLLVIVGWLGCNFCFNLFLQCKTFWRRCFTFCAMILDSLS